MVCRVQDKSIEDVLELLATQGFEGMADAMSIMLNEAYAWIVVGSPRSAAFHSIAELNLPGLLIAACNPFLLFGLR